MFCALPTIELRWISIRFHGHVERSSRWPVGVASGGSR
jgi:hypothetical protein